MCLLGLHVLLHLVYRSWCKCLGSEIWFDIQSQTEVLGEEKSRACGTGGRCREMGIQLWCSFSQLPEMDARMFLVAQAFLGSCFFSCYANVLTSCQCWQLPRITRDFCGPPMNFLIVKISKCEKKQIDIFLRNLWINSGGLACGVVCLPSAW